ncbi:MAG: glycosyltransferase family 2 protein [Mycobacterium sp.]|jgi:glycosyltransferase involved in cell wall biosynthesis|nr:glycosyltransferase family 2 protein [Mycobacterium sp.]
MTSAVTVVVCSRDRPERLAGALAGVRASLREGDQLVVVDSASVDDRTRQVGAAAGALVVRCDRPGLSRARNAGVAAAMHPVVLFTDDDCVPEPGWVAAMAAAFAADPRLGAAMGRVADAGGGGVPTSVDAAPVGDGELPVLVPFTAADPLDQVGHGANCGFRTAALHEIGGFDVLLGAGERLCAGEDKDAVHRLLAAGWHGAAVPGSVVGHASWRSRRAAVRLSYGYGLGFGALAAKATRADRTAGRRLAWRAVGPAGLGQALRALRDRYVTGVLVCLAWTAGSVVGLLRGWRMPLWRGLFHVPDEQPPAAPLPAAAGARAP